MPKKTFALADGEAADLTITWKGYFRNTVVDYQGQKIMEFTSRKELTAGNQCELPDGRTLLVKHTNKSLAAFAGNQLIIQVDGEPAPGSTNHPKTKIDAAVGILYVIALFSILLGAIAWLFDVQMMKAMGVDWFSILFGLAFAGLGWFASRGSLVAVAAGLMIITVDTAGMIMIAIDQGRVPVVGVIIRVLFISGLFDGLRTMYLSRGEGQIEVEKKLWKEPLGIGTGVFAGLLLIFTVVGLFMGGSPAAPSEEELLDDSLTREFAQMNLPMMLDSDTRLDRAWMDGSDIYYKYTMINFSADQIDIGSFEEQMRKHITQYQCNSEHGRTLFKFGKTLHFDYVDNNEKELIELEVDQSSCQ